MADIITKIVRSSLPPKNTSVLWYNGHSLKIYNRKEWRDVVKLLSEETMTSLIETLDSHKMSTIEFSQDPAKNLELLETLELTINYICNYKLSEDEIIHGTYYNGTISSFYNNEITLWNVDFNTGVISKQIAINCEFLGTEVILDVCSSGSVEADKNLEKLTKAYIEIGDHFTVNIDAGIGVAKFIPARGGEGHITTAEGVNVHYLIGTDGTVIKQKEIDLNTILADLDARVAALETV